MCAALYVFSAPALQPNVIRYWKVADQHAAATRFKLLHHLPSEQLEREYPNIRASVSWLIQQSDANSAALLLDYITTLAPQLLQRNLSLELESWCQAGLQACGRLQRNPAAVLLVQGETQYALGRWEQAGESWQSAATVSLETDKIIYARAISALGRLQVNQGKYKLALDTLAKAESLLAGTNETDEIIKIRSEIAAYYLNRRELDKALQIFLDMDRLQKESGATQSSEHTLLMIGVTYRQKRVFDKAIYYLSRLYQLGKQRGNTASMATAAHHLAWAYIEHGMLDDASNLCGQALALYKDIRDPRGLSDGYEQLGAIFLERGNTKKALEYLNKSIQMRKSLGNQPGLVSSLRRLALAHLLDKNYRQVASLLLRILTIYIQLGVFSRQRAFALFRDFIIGLKKSMAQQKKGGARDEISNPGEVDRSVMETFSRTLIK